MLQTTKRSTQKRKAGEILWSGSSQVKKRKTNTWIPTEIYGLIFGYLDMENPQQWRNARRICESANNAVLELFTEDPTRILLKAMRKKLPRATCSALFLVEVEKPYHKSSIFRKALDDDDAIIMQILLNRFNSKPCNQRALVWAVKHNFVSMAEALAHNIRNTKC
jgi:hypothetical protein